MKSYRKYLIVAFSLLGFVYSGCRAPETIVKTDRKQMPQAYENVNDSTNSADIKWKDFLSDKNLVTLIDSALKNNFDVLMTLQRIEFARASSKAAKGSLFPTVGANTTYWQRKFGYYTMDDAGNRVTEFTPGDTIPKHLPDYFIGLQTSWEVDIWGKLRSKKKAALLRYLSSVEVKNLVITNLVSDVANTYYELLATDNELDIIRETIKLQQDALEIIKVQKDAGTVNELAVKQFEAEVLNTQGLEFETNQKITEIENKLNFLLGRFPQAIIREKVNLTNDIPIQIKEGIPPQLLKNRPDIKQAEFELLATKFDVRAAKAAFYPTVNISGSLGFQAFNTAFLFITPQSLAYNLIGSLTAPLLNRSAIKAQFKYAKASQIEAMLNYQKTILNGYVEVSNELSGIKNLEQIYNRKTKQVEALTMSIDISNDLFKSGRANYLEVLMVQSRSLQSKLELVNTKKRQFNATINIYKALEGGWR